MNLLKKIILNSVSCVLLLSCSENEVYTVGMLGSTSIKKIDPALIEHYNYTTILNQVCAGLVMTDQKMEIVPDIAKSWSYSKTGKAYYFKIDTKRRFFDGQVIEARDVVYSLDRARLMPDKDDLSDIKSITALDTETVKIRLNKFNPRILYKLSTSAACILNSKKPFIKLNNYEVPNSLGAYSISKIDKNIRLQKNDYFPYKHREDKIQIQFLDTNEAIKEFRENKVHDLSFYYLNKEVISSINNKKVIKPVMFFSWSLILNPSSSFFNNVKLRSKFLSLLDANEITKKWSKEVTPGEQLIPTGMLGHSEIISVKSIPLIGKKLESEGKFSNKKKRIRGALIQGMQEDKNLKKVLTLEIIKKTKFAVDIDILPMNKWSEEFAKKSYDFYVCGIDANSNDPLSYYRYFIAGFEENALGYNDVKLNTVFSSLYSTDMNLRSKLDYQTIHNHFLRSSYALVLGYPLPSFIYSKDVLSAHMHPLGQSFNQWWKIGR